MVSLDTISTAIQSLIDDDKELPIHVGEVMSVWTYLAAIEEAITIETIAKNTTTDDELLELVDEALKICCSQAERLKKFMTEEGIPLPPASEPKPKSEPNAIPLGAKLTDYEIANMISIKFAGGIVECAMEMGQAIRNDIGAMWAQILAENALYGSRLKKTMRRRGWIKIPPAYYPPGVPQKD